MPLALRALIMSGVLVTLIVNVAMPAVSAGVSRLTAGAPPAPGRVGDGT
jgi:hypothetical protein